MARAGTISVWVNPGSYDGGVVHFVRGYAEGQSQQITRPYTWELAQKLVDIIEHLMRTGWRIRPFYGNAVGWVAEKGD